MYVCITYYLNISLHLKSHPIPVHPIPSQIPFPSQSQIPSQIPFKLILAFSGCRRMGILPFEPGRRDKSNSGMDAEIFDETSNNAVIKMPIRRNVKWRSDKNADLMTFRQLTWHPVVVEEWEYHHL